MSAGIATRDATEADHPVYARLFGDLGIPDPVPSAADMRAHLGELIVACAPGGDVVGFARWRAYGPLAHVVNVVTDKAWRGRRVGAALLDDVRGRARAQGCARWYLNVKRDNAPAIRLYERCGFADEAEAWALRLAWADAHRFPIGPRAVAELVAPADDAAIAARFGYEPARLPSLRARPGTVLVGLFDVRAREPRGVAAFSPQFPGASPFATEAPLAGALLRACAPYADARFDHLMVNVEGDAALRDALVAGGATVALSIVKMSAAIAP